ncbi:hypothetical protein ScalyP_jg6175 [Parmales sp. scaly parma]|nr:hypothetical protein ScalyP_jg6175 [Parmales sp. scaly parma]
MNDLVIVQTTQGLASYLHSLYPNPATPLHVIIGYDHRCNPTLNLSSLKFAKIASAVFAKSNISSTVFSTLVATPLVPFAVQETSSALGIMVTASHNPKEDDGFKVYWGNGCQIIPPHDSNITEHILKNLTPWKLFDEEALSEVVVNSGETTRLVDLYFKAISNSLVKTSTKSPKAPQNPHHPPPKFAYTAMHGVGHPFTKRSFEIFNLPEFIIVESQIEPDFTFPTVGFPNPEEKGALEEAKSVCEDRGGDIILANDPDADRLAVAEKDRETNEWTVFHGNEIGVMLGHWLWTNRDKTSTKPVAMVASAVSSKMLRAIAEVEGFRFEETLTGFKWIGSRSVELREKENCSVLFSYEEAIGFCCGEIISDKDGVSAAGVFATLANSIYEKGMNMKQHMQSLYAKYGEFVTNNGYYFCHDPKTATKIFSDMQNGGKYWGEGIGEYKIKNVRDLSFPGYDSSTEDKKPTLPVSKASPMITITFENGCCMQFRASGTEPKFKYYIELRGGVGESKEKVEGVLKEMSEYILEEIVKPDVNGLLKP